MYIFNTSKFDFDSFWYQWIEEVYTYTLVANTHRKTQVSNLTHLSHSGSLQGQKDSIFTYF